NSPATAATPTTNMMVPAANRNPRKRKISFMREASPETRRLRRPLAPNPGEVTGFSRLDHPSWPAVAAKRRNAGIALFYVETEADSPRHDPLSVRPRRRVRPGKPRREEAVDRIHQRIRRMRAPDRRHQVHHVVLG